MVFELLSCDETCLVIKHLSFKNQLYLRLVNKECNRLVYSSIEDVYLTEFLSLMQALSLRPNLNNLPKKWLLRYAHSSSSKRYDLNINYMCARCHAPVVELGSCCKCLRELRCPPFPFGRVMYGPTLVILTTMICTMACRRSQSYNL